MVLEKRGTISEDEIRLFFLLFVIQKERFFTHFIKIKCAGGVCEKQIDRIQRG